MATLAFRADLKLATQTLEAIDRATQASAEDGMRPHLGASLIGRPCERALWYTFRWASQQHHGARLLRLFARGHREEENLTALLRSAGVTVMTVDPVTGHQFSFGGGHFGGSMDGACVGLPEAPKTWHVWEAKTHSAKSFNDLTKKGVQDAKPEHWAQVQCYMAWSGMERALYVAVCKDDDRLHLERVDYDKDAAEALMAKAARIVNAPTPPEGISDTPDYYLCKWCEHKDLCHGTAAPQPTCRSCAHSTPEPGGTWTCARYASALTTAQQKQGCQAHRVIPVLLRNFAEPLDASAADNWVTYQLKTGGTFTNGAQPRGYTSAEIYACQDKSALGTVADQFANLRQQFGAEVVG